MSYESCPDCIERDAIHVKDGRPILSLVASCETCNGSGQVRRTGPRVGLDPYLTIFATDVV